MSEETNGVPETAFPGTKGDFYGFAQYDFALDGGACRVVVPKEVAAGKPWVWRAQFWGHEPQFDIDMLNRGYHLAFADVGNSFGSPAALARWDELYAYLHSKHKFADRAVLEGMSRGGLYIFRWAAQNPDKVACIYADNPVCDFKSWPAGKGVGRGSPGDWQECLRCYGMTEAEALAFEGNPIDVLKPLAEADIALLHIVGDADDIVPVAENTAIVEERYTALGGRIDVIHKPGLGHHPHSLKDPGPIVEFVLRNNHGN